LPVPRPERAPAACKRLAGALDENREQSETLPDYFRQEQLAADEIGAGH
jgi:hypothetical protein